MAHLEGTAESLLSSFTGSKLLPFLVFLAAAFLAFFLLAFDSVSLPDKILLHLSLPIFKTNKTTF